MSGNKPDYKKLGFKAGLEIHQQLDTPKLFSGAPSFLRSDEPDYVLKRKLHIVAGETGEVDVAVRHEALLDKNFYYEGYNDTVTLVELDEEPPRPVNEDALDVGLQIALLLNCRIYSVTQVMRKTVIDGSNTSGFQRTMLIARDGFVETSFGKVPVETVMLEEDAARRIKEDKKSVTFRLDRLGIPLVEIATAPVMTEPEQVKECALKVGEILRACRVKRGIGTIRQDVNVSVKGHERVEIKGFQDPKMMVRTIDIEIGRQMNEIGGGITNGGVRNALADGKTEFLRPLPGRARMYPETDLELLRIDKKRIDRLKRKLPKLRGELRSELKKKGLSEEMVNLIISDGEYLDSFGILSRVCEDVNLVAKMITLWRQEIVKKTGRTIENVSEILNEGVLENILDGVKKGKIDKGDVKDVMVRLVEGQKFEDAVSGLNEKANDDEIEKEIRKIIKEKPGLRPNAYMGLVMQKFKGKLDAKKTMEIVRKIVGG